MEHNPEKNKKGLQNLEFQGVIKKSEESIKTIREFINNSLLKDLADFIQYLEYQQDYLQTIEEVINEGYSSVLNQKDIEKVKEEINKTKDVIIKINTDISEFILYKSVLDTHIEEFKNLENKFRNVLLKIDSKN